MPLVYPDQAAAQAATRPASDSAAQVAAQGVRPQQPAQQPAGRLVMPQERERTWGQAAADTGVQLAEGVNTILGAIPSLIAPDSRPAEFFRDNAEFWRKKQSDALQVRSDLANVAIDKAGEDGVIAQVLEAASQYSSDPGLAARFVVTNLPSMIPSIGAAKLAQVATAARTAAAVRAGTMAPAAAAAAGATAATTAGGVTNAALNAGGARGEAFEDIKRTLLQRGYSEEEATQRALDDSRLPAAVGGVTGFISGRSGLESALFGVGGTGNALRRGAGKLASELGGEQLEEVAPKLATNYQAGQYDSRPMTQDVGRTIVETAIGSGPQSVAAGLSEGLRQDGTTPAPAQAPAPTAPGQPPVAAPVPAPTAPQTPAAPAGTIIPPAGDAGAPGAAAVPALDPAASSPDLDAQNRDRTRPASVLQMQSIAQSPDYLRLGPSRSPDTGAPMVFAQGDDTGVISDVARGREDVAVMSDGQRVPFQYAVVDASLLQPSNFADGTPNPLFSDETPGLIKALNNGRSAGLRSAWAQGTATQYAADLEADTDQHGVSPEAIRATPNPVLVRIYSQADNKPNMAARSQGQGLGMSPGELARQDAPLIDAGLLAVWQGGDVADTRNLDFVRGFVGRLQGTGQDLAGMMTQAGTLSPDGRKRIQAALAQSAYGDADLIGEMFDSVDTDIKAIGEALKMAAPEWADMRDSARTGVIDPAADITPALLGAVGMVRRARQQRQSLSDLARQTDITTGQTPDPMVLGVLRMLYGGEYLTRPMGRDRMAEFLREYARLAKGITPDAGLFGDAPAPLDVLTALTKEDTNGQQQPGATQPAAQPGPGSQQPDGGGRPGGNAGAGGAAAAGPVGGAGGTQPAAGSGGQLAQPGAGGQAPAPVAGQGYEARLQDRRQRIAQAKTPDEAQAVLQEEYQDSERHFEGTTSLEKAARGLTQRVADETAKREREAEDRRRLDAGEWVEDDALTFLYRATLRRGGILANADNRKRFDDAMAAARAANPDREYEAATDRGLSQDMDREVVRFRKKPAAPGQRSDQFKSYAQFIQQADTVPPGMIEAIRFDERLEDGEAEELVAMAQGKGAPTQAPAATRAKRKDGRTVPQAGDKVFTEAAGFGGSPAVVRGEVRSGSNGLFVSIEGAQGLMGEQAGQKRAQLSDDWTLMGEEHPGARKRRESAERIQADADKRKAEREAMLTEAAKRNGTLDPSTVKVGDTLELADGTRGTVTDAGRLGIFVDDRSIGNDMRGIKKIDAPQAADDDLDAMFNDVLDEELGKDKPAAPSVRVRGNEPRFEAQSVYNALIDAMNGGLPAVADQELRARLSERKIAGPTGLLPDGEQLLARLNEIGNPDVAQPVIDDLMGRRAWPEDGKTKPAKAAPANSEVTSSRQPLSDDELADLERMLGHAGAVTTKDLGGGLWRAEATGGGLRNPVRVQGSTESAARRNLLEAVRIAKGEPATDAGQAWWKSLTPTGRTKALQQAGAKSLPNTVLWGYIPEPTRQKLRAIIGTAQDPAMQDEARPPRTAGQAAASAAQNAGQGLTNAIDGLGALFGGKSPGRLGSGIGFDEETYAKAKPLFQAALANFKDAATDIKEAMRTIVRMVLDKFGEDAARNMQPYVVRYIRDVRDGVVDGQQAGDATTTPGTRLSWANVGEWIKAYQDLQRRAPAANKYRQIDAHIAALTDDKIEGEQDAQSLRALRALFESDPQLKPPRGQREGSEYVRVLDAVDRGLKRLAAPQQQLPAGWTEARPGGMATNPDPETGGIVDVAPATGKWFFVSNRKGQKTQEGFATRAEALQAVDSANTAQTNQESPNAEPLQPGRLPPGTSQPAQEDAAPGPGNRQPVDAGMAGEGAGPDSGGRVPAGADGAGTGGAQSPGQRNGNASGEARNPPGVGPEPGAPGDFDLAGEDIGTGGLTKKYRDNIAAIKIIKALEAEARPSTADERRALARYVGWGALKGVFDPANKQWAKQHAELRSLLTDKEWEAARASTLNAHFTSPVVVNSMYSVLERLGATRGRLLEPSVGSGNFFGLMPKSMRSAVQLFGVELDPITSRIAAGLYPSAKVRNQGFEDFDVPGGFFDIAVGNPPFGNEPLADLQGTPYSGWSIHNYFFAKTIDKLRPGGVMAMVVSHNFLDAADGKARRWIADRASLIGAVRLPRTAFMENAGTEVVTDIIVFQKHDANGLPADSRAWLNLGEQSNTNPKTGDVATHKVNRYFLDNPGSVLGTPSAGGTMYKANEYTVEPSGDLEAGLKRWEATLPEGIFTPIDRTEKMQADEVPDGVKVGSFFVAKDGSVRIRAQDEAGERRATPWTAPNDKAAARIKGMVGLRDGLRAQMRLERSPEATEKQIEAHRRELNRLYDNFQKAYGFANDPTNRRLFIDDTEASLVLALEFDYDRGVSDAVAAREGIEPRKPSARKADIFKRRVLFPPQDGMVVSNARDAMLASLNFRGTLDLDYMSRLYGKDQDAIVKELGDLVFAEPGGKVVTADEYLSGDVKTKLAEAEVAAKTDAAMTRNVEALRKVIPEDKRPSEIHAAIGAKFVPGNVLEEFAKRISGGTVKAHYVTSLGRWLVSPASNADSTLNVGRWGTGRMPALSILDYTISGKSVVVTDTFRNGDGSTTTVVNEKETEAARDKQRAIQEEWQGWLWSDPERSARIVADYNEQMNRWVDRRYDGAHLTLPGKVPDEVIGLLPHQKNGVWRALQSRQILLDHVVGAGKTFQMVSIAMELRRTGVARKPLFAVPNHLTLQWFSEFARLYPGSNVLAATPEDFSKGNRERFFSKIITGDWDAVIVGHSSLKKIALPAETEQEVLTEQVREISDAIEMMKRGRGDSRIVGDMERIKRNLEAKMKTKLAALGSRDKVVTFDELGVDAFFVDELHEFKNLFYTSTMDRVPGMGNPNGSDKAFDLFVKLQWMFNTLGKQAPIIGATGTPVSNSLVEMFNMQRFLQYPQLKEEGLHVFDAWARQFGSVENVYEVSPSGTGYRSSNRFSKFKNLGALMAHYNAFADVVTLDDLKAQEEARGSKFPVPKIRGGRPTVVVAERSPLVANFMGVPKLEMGTKGPVFGVNFADGETVSFEEKDGKFRVTVASARAGEAPVTRLLGGAFETEAEARLAVVEAALSPRIGVDPNSILGQFQNLRQLTKETKGRVNALSLTGAANKAGLDYRLIEPSAPDFPGSKINMAIENMMVEYRRWEADKGAQLVFCDLSVPLSERGNLANTARRLYVREDGILVHKRGTMHTVEGFEALPFFLVQSGAGATKTFAAYDAATGILLRSGFKSKGEALVWVTDAAKNEDKRQRWLDQREAGQEITQDLIDDYDNANEIDASESPYITPQDIAGVSASAKFSVYDDIKAKLVKKGVPESEIAFIHDYSTPAAKDKLFKAVRRGDVRFLLGSTPKMGAGTNVQNRLVALHHIDAPWRPSDLEQREGRIIRRGNELYERDPEGFEIGLYRYATKQTYDTRRWQILEHKARGIEQLRNYDGMSNEIEDIDGEAANAAEMKAAASGDPLILRETQLRNDVKRLETLQAAHADAVTSAVQRANDNRRYYTEYGPKERAEYEALKQIADKYPVPEDGLPSGVRVEGKTFTDRKEFTQAIAQAIGEILKAGSPVTKSVQYRGLRFTMSGSSSNPFRLEETNLGIPGSLGMWLGNDAISASGLVQRMANYVERIGSRIEQIDASIVEARDKEQKWLAESRKSFGQAKDLEAARQQHKRVQRLLLARGPEIPAEQKPILEKAQERQRKALRAAGFGDALDELMASATASEGEDQAQAQQEPVNRGTPAGTGSIAQTGAVEGNEPDVVFLRKSAGPRPGAMRAADVQAVADTVVARWESAPPVVVVQSLQDAAVPQAVRDEDAAQRKGGAAGSPAGFFYGGSVYLVADGIKSVTEAIETLHHEALGHYGLRALYGSALDGILDQIGMARMDLMRTKAAQYGKVLTIEAARVSVNVLRRQAGMPPLSGASLETSAAALLKRERAQVAEEVLAGMAQSDPSLGFVRRAVAAIRTWLRDNVPALRGLRLTDDEIIRDYILPARAFVERGAKDARASGMSAAFSRMGQALRTSTPEFKRWFGDSVVTESGKPGGKPLVVYHGTRADKDFAVFRGPKIYFSPDPAYASGYADGGMIPEFPAEKSRVIPVYLSAKKPLDLRDMGARQVERGDLLKRLEAAGVSAEDIASIKRNTDDFSMYLWTWMHENSVRMAIQKAGFDAVFQQEWNGAMMGDAFIVFEPTQIKSAIGNNGQFDPTNPDIRFARGARSNANRMTAEQVQAEVKALMPRVDEAYEAGNLALAERLDARLETLMEALESNFVELEEDQLTAVDLLNPVLAAKIAEGEQGDAEADVVRNLANTWKELSDGRWGYGNMTASEKADLLRGMLDDYAWRHGGLKPRLTARAILDAAEDAFKAVYGMRAEQLARIRRGRDLSTVRPASTPMFARGPAPALTAAQRAENILSTPVMQARPLDRVFRTASRLTGLEYVTKQVYGRAAYLLDRFTPETIKAGIVSDYGVPEAVIDMRVTLQGRQRQQLRKAGELLDKLANLTREESRIAYEWMNMDGSDPRAYLSMMQGLPEESVKVLQEVQRMIDDLSKEAVRLGQLDARSYERNKFAYLRRTYDRYLEELSPQQQRAHQKATRILGDQYRMRGLVEPVDMAKIKSGDPEWWGRKEQEGKGDAGLVNQKFIKLERLKPTGAGTIPLPGMTGKADGKVLEVVYWPAERTIPAKYSEWRRNEVFEVRDVKGGKVVLWRDFTKDEREAMGEVDEARFAIARTLQRMVHDVEVGRYLEGLSQKFAKADGDEVDGPLVEASESWHRAFKPDEWVKVPDSKITGTSVHRYGKLAGKYLPGPIWNDVRFAVNGPTRPLGEVYSQMLTAWKVAKTALTPAVHMNNVMANLVMADWHDVGAAHVSKALRIILAAHQQDGKGGLGRLGNVLSHGGIADRDAALAIMNRYRDAGGDIGSWATQEVAREQMAPLLDAVLAELGRDGDSSVQGQIGVMAALQHMLHLKLPEAWAAFKQSKPATVVGTEAKSMIDLYQAEDDVFRLAAWLAAKEQGMDDLRAGREARRSFLDYDINAPWVDAMRRSAWPFISFTYRAVPMLLEIAGKKPHKLMKLATLLGALNMVGMAMSGDDEGEDERRRRLLPEEKAGRVWGIVPKLIRMPWDDKNGSPVYLDIRRFVPVGDIVDTGATQAAVPLPPGLMPGGPLVILGEVLMNKSAFTGKPIVLNTDTPTEVASKVLGHVYKGFTPNLPGLPGTYATDAIVNAASGKTDAFGREQSVAQAVASSVGVKLGSYPEDVLRRNTMAKAKAEEREIETVLRGLQRQRQMNAISQEEFDQKAEVQRQKLRKLGQETREKMGQ